MTDAKLADNVAYRTVYAMADDLAWRWFSARLIMPDPTVPWQVKFITEGVQESLRDALDTINPETFQEAIDDAMHRRRPRW